MFNFFKLYFSNFLEHCDSQIMVRVKHIVRGFSEV